jgi:hypothetical protein
MTRLLILDGVMHPVTLLSVLPRMRSRPSPRTSKLRSGQFPKGLDSSLESGNRATAADHYLLTPNRKICVLQHLDGFATAFEPTGQVTIRSYEPCEYCRAVESRFCGEPYPGPTSTQHNCQTPPFFTATRPKGVDQAMLWRNNIVVAKRGRKG